MLLFNDNKLIQKLKSKTFSLYEYVFIIYPMILIIFTFIKELSPSIIFLNFFLLLISFLLFNKSIRLPFTGTFYLYLICNLRALIIITVCCSILLWENMIGDLNFLYIQFIYSVLIVPIYFYFFIKLDNKSEVTYE
jgi:hypothetical protein